MDLPGKLPAFCDRELMMGMKMPPALAVVEGMAGAIRASANPRPYASPNVLFPKALTNNVATRSPKPVFSNPCQEKGDTVCSSGLKLGVHEVIGTAQTMMTNTRQHVYTDRDATWNIVSHLQHSRPGHITTNGQPTSENSQ